MTTQPAIQSRRSPRGPLLRWAIIIFLVLLVPIVPFLIFGPAFEAEVRRYLDRIESSWILATLVAVVLATDVFLPVPSSLVSTLAGAKLGIGLGTLSFVAWDDGGCLRWICSGSLAGTFRWQSVGRERMIWRTWSRSSSVTARSL